MPYFSSRRWTCTTTMSQTQTATVALATTVSHHQLILLFCIPPLPPVSPLFSIHLSRRVSAAQAFPLLLSFSSNSLRHWRLTSPIICSLVYFHHQSKTVSYHSFTVCFPLVCLFLCCPDLTAVEAKMIQPCYLSSPLGPSNPTSKQDNYCCP